MMQAFSYLYKAKPHKGGYHICTHNAYIIFYYIVYQLSVLLLHSLCNFTHICVIYFCRRKVHCSSSSSYRHRIIIILIEDEYNACLLLLPFKCSTNVWFFCKILLYPRIHKMCYIILVWMIRLYGQRINKIKMNFFSLFIMNVTQLILFRTTT